MGRPEGPGNPPGTDWTPLCPIIMDYQWNCFGIVNITWHFSANKSIFLLIDGMHRLINAINNGKWDWLTEDTINSPKHITKNKLTKVITGQGHDLTEKCPKHTKRMTKNHNKYKQVFGLGVLGFWITVGKRKTNKLRAGNPKNTWTIQTAQKLSRSLRKP